MWPNYINILPPELLLLVFEFFDPEECSSTVSKICTRWSEILARYPPKARTKTDFENDIFSLEELNPEQIVESNFEALKQLQGVRITPGRFKTPEDKARLDRYLFTPELVQNLECFVIDGWYFSSEVERVLHLPNVERFRISGTSESADQPNAIPCRLVAPKLRTFYQHSDTIREPLVQFSEQISGFYARHRDKAAMFAMIKGLRFTNVRKLSLFLTGSRCLHESDFTLELKALFGRLIDLELWDGYGVYNPVFGIMFEEAKNLESLNIVGAIKLSAYDMAQINKLKKLKYLRLNVIVEDKNPQNGLSLPNLTKLEIWLKDLVPLKSVPSLRTLVFAEPDEDWPDLALYLSSVAHQLERLELDGIFLEDDDIELIGNLDHLLSLKMSEVQAEFSVVEKLFGRLKNLRRATFDDCRLAETIVLCGRESRICDCEFCCDKDGEFTRIARGPTERTRNFFETLRSQHADCAIGVDIDRMGRMVKCLKLTLAKDGVSIYGPTLNDD